jgi:hypothetical protein
MKLPSYSCTWLLVFACLRLYKKDLDFVIAQELLHYIRSISPAHLYATSMPPPVVQQVISALKVIMGEDGTDRGTIISPLNMQLLIHVPFNL